VTNWLAPERLPVRLCLFVMMGAGLLLAVAIPHAFTGYALVFAVCYVGMQLGRTAFFLWAARDGSPELRRAFWRIFAWFGVSAVYWLVGAVWQALRPAAWTVALIVEYAAPAFYYWVPGLGRSRTRDWDIAGGHLAERCALFVIIALGESLLMTGTAFADQEWESHTPATLLAFASAAVGSILMWWIYFDTGAHRAHHRISHSADPGRQGRIAYTYIHTLIVGGIIVSAVADELLLTHGEHGGPWIVILAGPLLYLTGTALFKWVMNDRRAPPFSHLVGFALLLVLIWPAHNHLLSTLALGIATTGVLLVVAIWESVALSRPARSLGGFHLADHKADDGTGDAVQHGAYQGINQGNGHA
jgi:low temperature requirement protein LtrA